MSKNQNTIPFSILKDIEVTKLLQDLYSPSKNKLKKFFDKKFLEKVIFSKKLIELPIDFVNDGLINPVYDGPDIDILFEDENFLVLNKPANIFVHPLKYSESNNCLSYIRSINKNILTVNQEQYDRGLLYRLDFETSGVLIYVKNQKLYFELRNNFNIITKEKIYLAKVKGKFPQVEKLENTLLATEANGSRIKALPKNSADTENSAILYIIESNYNAELDESLVKIKLITGLRHQIRVQLAYLGFPIIGDIFYGGVPDERLYLHALSYQIQVEGNSLEFSAKPFNF